MREFKVELNEQRMKCYDNMVKCQSFICDALLNYYKTKRIYVDSIAYEIFLLENREDHYKSSYDVPKLYIYLKRIAQHANQGFIDKLSEIDIDTLEGIKKLVSYVYKYMTGKQQFGNKNMAQDLYYIFRDRSKMKIINKDIGDINGI